MILYKQLDTPAAAMRYALVAMANRWLQLHQEIEAHTQHLTSLTREVAPELVQAYGIGPDTAAEMLITFGDNSNRVHSEAPLPRCVVSVPFLLPLVKPSDIGSTEEETAKQMLLFSG